MKLGSSLLRATAAVCKLEAGSVHREAHAAMHSPISCSDDTLNAQLQL